MYCSPHVDANCALSFFQYRDRKECTHTFVQILTYHSLKKLSWTTHLNQSQEEVLSQYPILFFISTENHYLAYLSIEYFMMNFQCQCLSVRRKSLSCHALSTPACSKHTVNISCILALRSECPFSSCFFIRSVDQYEKRLLEKSIDET